MTNTNDVRRAHYLLDDISIGHQPNVDDLNHLRSFLPELPKQKTLEEIVHDVYEAWIASSGDEWIRDGVVGSVISLEDWLSELHTQLQGLKDTSAVFPALPAGMRLAEHEKYGRCVVSPGVNVAGRYEVFYLAPSAASGTDLDEVAPGSLTFIDAEPAHPVFLKTEADYEDAPEGTIVAKDDISTAWIKRCGAWKSTDGDRGVRCPNWKVGNRIILRWGWKK